MDNVRPLRRVRAGVWKSRDGEWLFMRHESDPHPRRWFVYGPGETGEWPINEGHGHTTLWQVVRFIESLED